MLPLSLFETISKMGYLNIAVQITLYLTHEKTPTINQLGQNYQNCIQNIVQKLLEIMSPTAALLMMNIGTAAYYLSYTVPENTDDC